MEHDRGLRLSARPRTRLLAADGLLPLTAQRRASGWNSEPACGPRNEDADEGRDDADANRKRVSGHPHGPDPPRRLRGSEHTGHKRANLPGPGRDDGSSGSCKRSHE
jgi:hypothetical protein